MKEFVLCCNFNNKIIDCDETACYELRYTRKELLDKQLEDLMSPYVAKLHHRMIRHMKSVSIEDLKIIATRLKDRMSLATRYVIYDSNRKPILCSISVNIDVETLYNSVKISLTDTKCSMPTVEDAIPQLQLKYIGCKHERAHIGDFDNVTCVMMDLADSTQFVTKHSGKTMASVLSKVYDITTNIVLEFHPFVYVHEITGDSMFLVIDAPFMVKGASSKHSSVLTMTIVSHIQKEIDDMLEKEYNGEMYIRVGISRGSLSAGVIDGRTFRLFGLTVHMAQRMEALCPRGHVTTTAEFYESLASQLKNGGLNELSNIVKESRSINTSDVKGVGDVSYNVLYTSKDHVIWMNNLLSIC